MAMMAVPKQLYTVAEVAQILDLHRKTVELMYQQGRIGHVRIGRRVYIRDDQLTRFIDDHTVDPDA